MFGTQPFGKPFGMTSFAPDDEEDAPSPVMPGGPPSMPGAQQPQLGPQFNAPQIHEQGAGMFAAPPPRNPSFLGEGGVGRGIAGAIGDFLLQRAGASPIYAPQMQHLQEQAAQRQLALTKAQMERDAEARKIHYDGNIFWRTGPDGKPIKVGDGESSPTELETMMEASGIAKGSPEYVRLMNLGVQNKVNPVHPTLVNNPTTGAASVVMTDRNGPIPGQGFGGAQPHPVGARTGLPAGTVKKGHVFLGGDEADPSSWAPLNQGGPAPQGPGTFPRP